MPEDLHSKISAEIEAAKKTQKVLLKEIEFLGKQAETEAGHEKFLEMERKIANTDKENEELTRKLKEIEKKAKACDKDFAKIKKIKDSNTEKIDVF